MPLIDQRIPVRYLIPKFTYGVEDIVKIEELYYTYTPKIKPEVRKCHFCLLNMKLLKLAVQDTLLYPSVDN